VLPTSPGAGGSSLHSGGTHGSGSRGAGDDPGTGPDRDGKDDAGGQTPDPGTTTGADDDEPGTGTSDGSTTSPTPEDSSTPDPTPKSLELVSRPDITAPRTHDFAEPVTVRVVGSDGEPLSGAKVTFRIGGTTGSTFTGGVTSMAVTTDADGQATSSVLHAGGTAGAFTVGVGVEGNDTLTAQVTGHVTEPTADQLARTHTGTVYTAETGQEFADRVRVRATDANGGAVEGVKVTATMLTKECKEVDDAGPSFVVGDDARLLHTVILRTGPDGLLTLPTMTAGTAADSYVLRLRTAGLDPVDIPLTVTEPAASSATPSP
jgi:hypothetical protein